MQVANYDEKHIKSLDWKEHIRLRPGMYIGKLGDGSAYDDGIYMLLKEVIDNAVDEYVMGCGKEIVIRIQEGEVQVRDYGRGIPFGKLVECVSKINTGGKYESGAFKKSVGLNGVGTKAVNALSEAFTISSFRDGKGKSASFSRGEFLKEQDISKSKEKNGTDVVFHADSTIFKNFRFVSEIVENMLWNYVALNAGLTIYFNEKKFFSQNGLLDLLLRQVKVDELRYPIIHLRGPDIEVTLTHGNQYGEDHYSFVNGQYTTMGGTHQAALREGFIKTVKDHFKKDFEASDIRSGFIAAISVRIEDPVFESQTKTKLGSVNIAPNGPTIRSWIGDFIREQLDNYLYRHPAVAQEMLKKIQQSERERKEMAGIRKLANERAKKANVFNKKLRDCRVHLSSSHERREESTIFITEGDSASGSLTVARDVQTQAVFSLRGKPLNCFGLTKKIVYENEEFNLLQHALEIEESMDNLRFNRIVIATDADVDGMHIRLLITTFFLQYFSELVKKGHVYILQTPLFRVRNKQETIYCYDEKEKLQALKKIGEKAEITRFKGLGEISPSEFHQFIGTSMRLEPLVVNNKTSIQEMLSYYMGKNTQERQNFIIDNLVIE